MKNKSLILILLLAMTLALAAGCAPAQEEDSWAQQLYDARLSYVGDASELSGLLNTVFAGQVGLFTMELYTDAEPYGLKIIFEGSVPDTETMGKYACLVLALVDNLTECSWSDSGNMGAGVELEGASVMVGGADIKSFAASADKVEELLELLQF